MKKFNFHLEKLLSLREFYERQAEIDLARAIAFKDSLDLQLREIASLKVKTGYEFNPSTQVIDINDFYSAQNFIIRLDKRKDELIEKIILADKDISEKRKSYIAASSKRKIISKLKEKKQEEWKLETLKSEENDIDDIITSRFNNNAQATKLF